MSLPTFFRGSAADLWIGLEASEALGIMGGVSLVSDHFGVAGQATLHHIPSGARVAVPMVSWGSNGRSLGGWIPMALLQDGEIRIEGSVVDLSGNIATLSLGFILASGPAPQNGAVVLSVDALGIGLAFGTLAVPILVVLRPGFYIGFPAAGLSLVSFPPVSNSVRF